MFDAHCHIDDPRFDSDRSAVIAAAKCAGVRGMVVPAVSPDRWEQTLACAVEGQTWVALGVHPYAYAKLSDAQITEALERIPSLVAEHRSKIVAIGEVGFDGGLDPTLASPERQARIVQWHAALARELDLPLVLHVLRAHEQALAVLRSLSLRQPAGVIHSYSGGPELVDAYVSLGFYLSFAGSITRERAVKPLKAVAKTPLDRILVETDAPDQRPSGVLDSLQPDRCEPSHLTTIVSAAAKARGCTIGEMQSQTTENAQRLYHVKLSP